MEPILHREARLHGLTRDQLRHPSFVHPAAGVALPIEAAADLAARCRAVARVLPAEVVWTHLTAARLRGWRLPRIPDEPLLACSDAEAPHLDRRGVYVRRCAIPPEHRVVHRGLRLASPEWTVIELSEHLGLVDLVVVIDGALHRRDVTLERVAAAMRPGRRGVRVLRRALALADGRSESPWETVLRLLHVLSGIAVTPQVTLRDDAGEPVWALDLLIDGTRRAPEFDGGVHGREEVRRRDLRRDKVLARHGIVRFGYCAAEVLGDPAMVIADAEDALGLPRDPARLKLWLPEIEASSFSPAGYGRLLARLRRFARPTTPRPSRRE